MALLRRGIILLCIIFLCLNVAAMWPESKYYDPQLKEQIDDGNAQVIEVNKSFPIDNDSFKVLRIIHTSDQTYIRFALIKKENGWTFPYGSISLIDDKGREYPCMGAGSSGKSWGEEGLLQCGPIDAEAEYITIRFHRFDRMSQFSIPLNKGESANEK